jgi:DNA replication protein DnaC
MISTNNLNERELVELNAQQLLGKVYSVSGIPVQYHFSRLDTDWSTEFSPHQKLSGFSKTKSEKVKEFIQFYIDKIDTVLNGGGIKIVETKSSRVVKNIIFSGSKSSGKTFLLSVIAQSAINSGYKVMFLDWIEFFNQFQSWDAPTQNEKLLDAILHCDLLCIDSIYNYPQQGSVSFITLLDRILNSRKKNDLVTICSLITSENSIPNLGISFNNFMRETFKIDLPEAQITNENYTKRNRTKNT